MSAIQFQITSLPFVYSTVYSRHRSKRTSKLHVTGLCEGNSLVTGEFPTKRASNAENVSMWWHHHETSSHRPQCSAAGSMLPQFMPPVYVLLLSSQCYTVETLYSTIYYSKYFIELNIDKSTQYVALWTHKRHPIPRPFGRAMECLLWVLQQKLIVL